MAFKRDDNEIIRVNGIDATTGDYLIPDLTIADIEKFATSRPLRGTPGTPSWRRPRDVLAASYGIDIARVEQAGWAVIFAPGASPEIKEALDELLQHRRGQVRGLYREFEYWNGENGAAFLRRQHMGPGDVDPTRVPYYLVIVGSPEEIPYVVQYELDGDYAVGRLYFEKIESYAAYARSVVQAETTAAKERSAAFFATRNPGDISTRQSATRLAVPLQMRFQSKLADWRIASHIGESASKENLKRLITNMPSLLFTATHGLGFPAGHPEQLRHQGALLCQEWRPLRGGVVPPDAYFSVDDVDPAVRLDGLIAFCFACFSAGTPKMNDFIDSPSEISQLLVSRPFVAALPQKLLSQGALAVIGHVEKAWGYSFQIPGVDDYTEAFTSCLRALADRQPVGFAMSWFNDRFKSASIQVLNCLMAKQRGELVDPVELANAWLISRDSRNYAILGDPAARLGPVA